ncbi:MAG: hypothetical protein V4614_16730 [Pseudomonadota bacterium]
MDAIFHKGEWMEGCEGRSLSPHSFLLEQPPNIILESHFHRNNQFQLFVEGEGTIGRHSIGPVMIHYAGAYTGYGPLISGPQGLKYFTLRRVREDGYIPVSERKAKMLPGPKRHASSKSWQPLSFDVLECLSRSESHVLIPTGFDGLCANAIRLPPAAELHSGHTQRSEGQFVFVVLGSLNGEDISMERWEHIFVPASDPFPNLKAGARGCELLVFSLPSHAEAYDE